MRLRAGHEGWEGASAFTRDGTPAGTALRVHGDGDWPETLVLDRGDHRLALPAGEVLLARGEVRLPWSARRLTEAHPLDAEAHDDAAAVSRAAAAFEDPSRVSLADDPSAMTLSEERLDVRLEAVPTERVTLRKRVVEETVTVPVTVRREVVELVTEPVEPGTTVRDGATVAEGTAADVILHAERPVVGLEVVPTERVRLVKSFTTEDVVVGGDVRHEQAEVEHLPPGPSAA